MKHKIIFVVMLVTAAFFISCTKNGDSEVKNSKNADMNMNMDMKQNSDEMLDMYSLNFGTIKSITDTSIVIDSMMMGKDPMEFMLNIGANTPILNASDNMVAKTADLKAGDKLYAWVSSAYTASLPPQTTAKVLFTNVTDEAMLPAYVEVKMISIENDIINVVDTYGKKWTFAKTVQTDMYGSMDNMMNADSIKEGVKCLFWKSKSHDSMQGSNMAEEVVKILILEK